MSECAHSFSYQGVVTWPGADPLPGSGAHARIYADVYHCERCCELKLTNQRAMGNTYEKVRAGAVEYSSRPK